MTKNCSIRTNHSEETFVKILGILFDEKLLFDKRVTIVKTKVSKSLYSLCRVKNLLSSDTLQIFTLTLIIALISILWVEKRMCLN